MPSPLKDELFELVAAIPRGKVASYGALGRSLPNPVPAIMVGRWMAQAPDNLPWWRVVGSDGSLPLAKHNPALALIQEEKLLSEGVMMEDHTVKGKDHFFVPFPIGF